MASERKHFADFLKRQADSPRIHDEAPALPIDSTVQPVAGAGPPRLRQHADLLVIPDRLGIEAELGGEFADAFPDAFASTSMPPRLTLAPSQT